MSVEAERGRAKYTCAGAFGCPTIVVGDLMYFGQDRLDFVKEALREP
jgi:2-hydroxychromene-2-carboxylate isomerase